MKKIPYLSCVMILFFAVACTNLVDKEKESDVAIDIVTDVVLEKEMGEEGPGVVSSFVFVGCNRVDRSDQGNSAATNASTANLAALKRIYEDITALEHQPELFFFLGDLVLGESTTEKLDDQLEAWVKLYNNTAFSTISELGIELVAVPGNHEMLTYAKHPETEHDEWPLKGATELWMKHMSPYIPSDCEHVTGVDSLNNQATFSFVRNNIGFVVMNTDTYNPPSEAAPYGLEGMIPLNWIETKIKVFQEDPNIEHIFVLGHKPYYVGGEPQTGHEGFPDGPKLWPLLYQSRVAAMLSAHVHDYDREQPNGDGTYQIIAGNGGSPGNAKFFGYTIINMLSDGTLELESRGFNVGNPYYKAVPEHPMFVRDSTILTWAKNENPYAGS
jgi:hypothetical protein